MLLKARGGLEKRLAPMHVEVKWTEFPAGPQLLEGLNVGSIDFGTVGEAPPIFAQAAGADLVYVGNEPPASTGEAILVPKDSPIKSVAELKGRKVALNKGSNVHFLLVKLLEKAGVQYKDIDTVFLTPADARAAFERGSVDAWAIWEPFFAAAQRQTGARILADGNGVVSNHQFFLASRPYASKRADVVAIVLEELAAVDQWAKANPKDAATVLSPQIGLDQATLELALSRGGYGVTPVNDARVLSRSSRGLLTPSTTSKLIPKRINVRDATLQREHCQRPNRTRNVDLGTLSLEPIPMKTQLQSRTLVKQASPWVVPILLLIVWQWASSAGILPSRFLPAPRAVIRSFIELSASGELWSHVRVSALRALSGFVVGGGLGLLLGLLTGSLQWAETLLDTTIQMVRNIPPLALIPLVILWFGIDESAKLFLVALGVFFPLYINTFHGIRSVDRGLLEMGRIYGLSGWSLLIARLFSPGALPSDSRRRALLAWLDVGDPDRRRNHLSALRHWLHDDERTRIYADGCHGGRHSALRNLGQNRRSPREGIGTLLAALESRVSDGTIRNQIVSHLQFERDRSRGTALLPRCLGRNQRRQHRVRRTHRA